MIRLRDQHPAILVVGDLMIDHYLWGRCDRISPEAPVQVVDVQNETTVLGGAGNVITNLLALGAEVHTVSVVGDDPNGKELLAMLEETGVSTGGIVTEPGRKTSKKTRVIATHQQMLRFDSETKSDISAGSVRALTAFVEEEAPRFKAILLSDYKKGVLTPELTRAVIAAGKKAGVPVLVDPKGEDYGKYRGATLVTPNRKEAAAATRIPLDSDANLEKAGMRLRESLELEYAMITLSEEGMALFDGNGVTKIPAKAREVFDVTGAGDTVLATLGFGLACGLPVLDAAHVANCAAAVVVGKVGSATATLEEIAVYEQSLHFGEIGEKIKTEGAMEAISKELRRQGKTVVFTNGCFDILHRGHVEYLQATRRKGDVLVLGLNSDASVRRLKGPERPVVHEEDRAYMLAALEFVDYVVVFDEETPYELIKKVRPHVLTKGADYEGKEVVGSDVAERVELIPFVPGRSTTSTIAKIRGER